MSICDKDLTVTIYVLCLVYQPYFSDFVCQHKPQYEEGLDDNRSTFTLLQCQSFIFKPLHVVRNPAQMSG